MARWRRPLRAATSRGTGALACRCSALSTSPASTLRARRSTSRSRHCSAASCANVCRTRPICSTSTRAPAERLPSTSIPMRRAGRRRDRRRRSMRTGIVAQAQAMIAEFGFKSIKLKGGVFEPAQEVAAIKALRDAFGPSVPLRYDPNAVWAVETGIRWGKELEGLLEYLEDPVRGQQGMATVRREVKLPLATNMCTTSFDDLPGSVAARLGGHHPHRPSLLGRTARVDGARGALPDLRARRVDALEQPRRHLAGGDDASRRRDAESLLCARHALSLAVGRDRRRRTREDRRRLRRIAEGSRPWRGARSRCARPRARRVHALRNHGARRRAGDAEERSAAGSSWQTRW